VSLNKPIAALLLALSAAISAMAQAHPLKPFEPASVEQIVASHKGKPFLLLVWSMDCEFCQASLEVLAKARAANPKLLVVTVTTDPIADLALAGQVRTRLASLRLLDDAWSYGNEAPERLHFALDPAWRGEKPRSYWYDVTGKRSAYSGLIKAEKLAQWQRGQGRPASRPRAP
jgi:thiol-disulfide isomerase/thioredoxin